jgi:hypothetical protein
MEKEIQQARKTLKLLYSLVYPLNSFNYDYISATDKIRLELKNLCKEQMRPILFMLARASGIEHNNLNEKMEIRKLCQMIQNRLIEIAYSLTNMEKTLLTLKWSPQSNIQIDSLKLVCENIWSKYREDFNIIKIMYVNYKSLLQEETQEHIQKIGVIPDFWFFGAIQDIEKHRGENDNNIRKYIDFDVTTDQVMHKLNVNFEEWGYNRQEADFYVRLHDGFRSGKIPLNITRNELCKNIHKYF